MKSLNLLRLAALSAVLFSLSCKKRGQFEVYCKIEQIISKYQYNPSYPVETNVSTFTHNAWGDPVSIIQSNPQMGIPQSVMEKGYSYDANDNLIRSNVTYDNKINFLRTSLVLAFMMRDYSKNNYLTALSYNSKNLPTTYPVSTMTSGGGPVFFYNSAEEIKYTCDNNSNDLD
ncbi:hypothetical protein D3H65_22300 [Paraflavitalea soli]|uniref:Uncharacterized protein n=1 Tax=Paraflavitalea soli TaxID=2315862 RepID=A0A3B7N2J9_9BACT|nr:hypothetical protein [Paraflavitalea soli]AXY76561.1 hypothetical protein D3H65_22300 [Paraflavitalea soli]